VSDSIAPCLADALPPKASMLPLPAANDAEGERLPAALPEVIDAHVHLFPDRVFDAIHRWFEAYGWPIRYPFHTPEVLSFLFARGVSRVIALAYAHKPGMARALNAYMAEVCRHEPRVTGLATVLPGEPGARAILEEAFALGLSGVKLHCHVQCFSPDDAALHELYEACVAANRPVVIHAGREPTSSAYKCDPHALCSVERIERVITDYPGLRVVVPHLGADEYDGYTRLLERHDNLWLDTTMAIAGYLPGENPIRMIEARPSRIMYGTDFPNLPYAWDREVKKIQGHDLSEETRALVLGGTARALFAIS
jgi:predicted TIM-barrel fold metal-dependent hydrolase